MVSAFRATLVAALLAVWPVASNAVTWIEQAQFAAPNVPIIAVVSAAAEPLVSPYLQAPSAGDDDTPQLDGLISGLGGAADLEQRSGQPGAALAAWPGLGGGLLAAAALILIGNLVLGLPALLRRRR